ncbi:MAG: polysaccharide biosynthesis/export family protein [Candidatus Omnitrophota bacterium]
MKSFNLKKFLFETGNLKIFRSPDAGSWRVGIKTNSSVVFRPSSFVLRFCHLPSLVRRPASSVCFLLSIVFILSSVFCVSAFAEDYIIGPDDVLNISVYRETELDRTVRISSEGYFSFPLVGQVKAHGISVQMLELTMEQMLQKYLKNPQVTVFIEEYSTITVSGQVKNPGSYPLKGELTVIESISLAGGFTKIAARNNVKVMRTEDNKEKTIHVRVADISKKGNKTEDIPLKRGDLVFVPESMF